MSGGQAANRFPRADYRALDLYTPDRKPVSVDLSDNTNLWGTHPAALEVVRTADLHALARYPTVYGEELKDAAAAHFGVDRDQVATGCGSDDILDALWRAICETGGTVSWPAPTFSMIEPLCHMNGRAGRPVAWSGAAADPELLLAGAPTLVYVCRPNNPTGLQVDGAWVDALVDAAGEDGPVILFDEAYAEFAGETLIPLAVTHPRVLVARTLSKAYGLAGLRVGLGIGTTGLVREVEKSRGPYKVGRLAEAAAVAALRNAAWIDDTVRETVDNRTRLVDELRARGHGPLPSAANFIFLPVAPGRAKAVSDGLREHDVSVRPFPDCPDVGDGLRVTVGPWPMMDCFLAALDAVMEAHPTWARREVAA